MRYFRRVVFPTTEKAIVITLSKYIVITKGNYGFESLTKCCVVMVEKA